MALRDGDTAIRYSRYIYKTDIETSTDKKTRFLATEQNLPYFTLIINYHYYYEVGFLPSYNEPGQLGINI